MNWWKNYPWRMIQTNLREIDFRDLDPERFVADLKSFHATVALINAGGISASYPTELPWQAQNLWADNDKLLRLVELCHDNGIRVLARTDFSKVKEEIYLQHPQWAFRTAQGGVMNYNGYVQTCPSSVYQQEYAFETLREIFTRIPFDGLFCNMGGFQTRDYSFVDYGFCHCQACRTRFREMYGYDSLPEREDMENPVYVAYLEFQKRSVREYRRKMVDFLKTFDRELCFDDEDYARIESSTELHRRLPHWQYHASSNCRVILGDGSSGIICSNTSVDYVGYALREMAVSPAQQRLRAWQNIANLGGLDYYIMSRLDNHLDRSGFAGMQGVFAFHAKNEKAYQGLQSMARVLLHRSDRWVATEEEKGWIRTLTEAHIPFAEILPTEFASANMEKYDIIIFPDSQYLRPEDVERTNAFVAAGGTVICVGGTGLADERQGRKTVPALRCQGIARVREERSDMASAMFLLEDKKLFSSLPETDVIGLGDRYLYFEPDTARKMLRMIPVHPFGPPECCCFDEITQEAGFFVNDYGRGRAVTIPWYPGEFYARTGFDSLRLFMTNLLVNLCGAVSIAPELTTMVETTLSRGPTGNVMVQLVNGTGIFGVSFVAPVPVREVKLCLTAEECPKQVETLNGGTVAWSYDQGRLSLELDTLEEYEAVVVKSGRE